MQKHWAFTVISTIIITTPTATHTPEPVRMIELMTSLLPTLVCGLGVALISGYLGVFVIAQRLSFFSDALAHAALLGISVSFIFALPVNVSFVITALIFAALFTYALTHSNISSDTLIGVLSLSFLAISLLSISLFTDAHVDLEHYLMGSLSTVSWLDAGWVALCGVSAFLFLRLKWNDLILVTLNEELAQIEGINPKSLRLGLTLILALLVAVSIQLIGALLISALLIIPASSARQWASSVKHMALLSSVIACVSVALGVWFSHSMSTPSGPAIVMMTSLAFAISVFANNARQRR
ncbi:MAG: metal ABC transporter permease [Pseudomonadota bacterium]